MKIPPYLESNNKRHDLQARCGNSQAEAIAVRTIEKIPSKIWKGERPRAGRVHPGRRPQRCGLCPCPFKSHSYKTGLFSADGEEKNIFTGSYTVEALRNERPREYERLHKSKRLEDIVCERNSPRCAGTAGRVTSFCLPPCQCLLPSARSI